MDRGISRRAALTTAVLATTGCTFTPVNFNPESETPTPTAAKDPARAVDPEFFVRSREGSAKRLPEGKSSGQRISTPHLDGTLRDYFVGERLGLETLAQVGQTTALKAPPGYELAAFTLQGGLPGYLLQADDAITSELVLGTKVVPVPNLFDKFNKATERYLNEWEMFVFCVPVGAPVLLQITDEAKTVSVDVRTGVPTVDDAWKANTGFRERWAITCEPETGTFSRQFTTMPPATLEPDTGTLNIGLTPDFRSGLLPWMPTLGWAPEGQQWLAAPMKARIDLDGTVFPQVNIDVPGSFVYQDSAGVKQPAVAPKSVTTEALAREQADLIVIWPVSGRDGVAIVSFNAVGPMEVDYTNNPNMPAQFTSEAVPLDFTITFAPA